jgi:hypothetical protein
MSGLRIRGHPCLHPGLAKWESHSDRLDYYRGHRAGYEARMRKTKLVEAS